MTATMYANLPDDLIKNVLTYWSPKDAHKKKIIDYLMSKIDTIDMLLLDYKNERYGTHSIKSEDMKEMIDLFNRFGKIPHQINPFYSIKITKKQIIIKRISYFGKPLKNAEHYWIENYNQEHFDKLYAELPKGDSNYHWGLRNAHHTQLMKSRNTQEVFRLLLTILQKHIFNWCIENPDAVKANGYYIIGDCE